MKIVLVQPPLATLRADPLGSGIPYLPVLLAVLAARLRAEHTVTVIDAFGEDPEQVRPDPPFLVQGLAPAQVAARVPADAQALVLYLPTVMAVRAAQALLTQWRGAFPGVPRIVVENSQGVIGCSLERLADGLLEAGADYLVLGESEERVPRLLAELARGTAAELNALDGLIRRGADGRVLIAPARGVVADVDALPFPAWDLLPLRNYWRLGYAHGPMSGPYLALMTSRGCPYQCAFCSVPTMNHGQWRAQSAARIEQELEQALAAFPVREFHWEDLNPTASETRMLDLCDRIIARGWRLTWKLASGTKIETLHEKTLDRLRQAGCRYISFSPESGSARVLGLMRKHFDHAHALRLTRRMRRLGIASQACFVLGFPGETDADRAQTRAYVRELARAGVSEIALFILAPMPGTPAATEFAGLPDPAELTFAPTWREDYPALAKFRNGLYLTFLLWKAWFHPGAVLGDLADLVTRRFRTKAVMNLYRLWRFRRWSARAARAPQTSERRPRHDEGQDR